jgi:hypothetical protein
MGFRRTRRAAAIRHRRVRLLGALMLLVGGMAVVLPISRAGAGENCAAVEPVYALAASGALVEHRYCLADPGRFLTPRTIATMPADNATLFWGGTRPAGGSIVYAVTGAGQLLWYGQDAGTGVLGTGVEVGAHFGDWRNYRHLRSDGAGGLSGVDSRGHVIRWSHDGWRDGADIWSVGPTDLGAGCAKTRPVDDAARFPYVSHVGVRSDPPGYVYCMTDGSLVSASELPNAVLADSATAAPASGVTYALSAIDRGVARLTLERANQPHWRINATAGHGYRRIFAGRAIVADGEPVRNPYEWQRPTYGERPKQ